MPLHLILTFLLFFLILLDCSSAIEFTVGVSPSIIDLGEIERGTSKVVKFYLVTPSDESLLVYLEAERSGLDFFAHDQYKNLLVNYSEEDVSGWVEFLRNPIELTIGNETLKTKAGEIKGWREVSFLLNIPKEAEPGYHNLRIKPVPYIPPENLGQVGARVVAITSVSLLFDVPGDAKRDGIILDVTPGSFSGNRVEINTYFQNTGTVTISARSEQNLYDEEKLIENLASGTEIVRPGEIKALKTFLPTDKISLGKNYSLSTKVSYTTGFTSKNSSLAIQPTVLAPAPTEFPLWIIILIIIIVLIAIGIYKWYR